MKKIIAILITVFIVYAEDLEVRDDLKKPSQISSDAITGFKGLKTPKSIIGFVISILGLYVAFKDYSFNKFFLSLKQINYIYLVLASLFLWISVWFRALRWKYLFNK